MAALLGLKYPLNPPLPGEIDNGEAVKKVDATFTAS
jgi:hypothetical protein